MERLTAKGLVAVAEEGLKETIEEWEYFRCQRAKGLLRLARERRGAAGNPAVRL